MSEKISRRVFLKTTGLAVLSVAAAGALEGCNVLDPTPGNPVLPTVTQTQPSPYVDEIGLSALSGQWTSVSVYEPSDDKAHNYLYAALYIKNSSQTSVSLTGSSCSCGKVRSLAHITLTKDKNAYQFYPSNTAPASIATTIPVYIDIGSTKFIDLYSQEIKFTLRINSRTFTFSCRGLSDDSPTISVN